VLVLVLKVDVL